ncbi:hypothetical protein ACIRP0_27585 [Streptomyces sp. NPDC101733]|uniref:hypothetical protein n=1 Tax=unclassified Streptomyces TaxID=2593676 RepID=UPI00382FDA7D
MAAAYDMHTRDWAREPGRIPISCTPGDIWYGRYVDARPEETLFETVGAWAVDEEPEPLAPESGWPLESWVTELAEALEEGRCMILPDGRRDAYDWPVLTAAGGLIWADPRDERLLPEGGVLLDGPR